MNPQEELVFLGCLLNLSRHDLTEAIECLGKILWNRMSFENPNCAQIGALLKRLRDPVSLTELFDRKQLQHRTLARDEIRRRIGEEQLIQTGRESICTPLSCLEIIEILEAQGRQIGWVPALPAFDYKWTPKVRRAVLDSFASTREVMSELCDWRKQYSQFTMATVGERCAGYGLNKEEVMSFFKDSTEEVQREILKGFDNFAN